MEQLQENDAVRQFLKLLMENSPDKGKDYSMLLWQLDGMASQLDAALRELNEVKSQLAGMQEGRVKQSISHAAEAVGNRLYTAQKSLSDIKDRIVAGAKEAAAGFKRMGVSALDKAVSALGIKKALEAVQKDLGSSAADIKKCIEKIENAGHELRSVGGHIKNVGRVLMGKERQTVDGGKEGRFQAAVLAPLRTEKKILARLNNMTLAAIGNVERLEQAAGRGMEKMEHEREGTGRTGEPEKVEGPKKSADLEGQPDKEAGKESGKNKEKSSILRDLEEKKALVPACPAPSPDKARKLKEAAL